MSLTHILTSDLKVSAFSSGSVLVSSWLLSQQCYLSISGDVSEDAVSNPPSSKQATHMDIAKTLLSKKQAEPSSSKQAVRASKKQTEPSSKKATQGHSAGRSPGPDKVNVDVAEIMKLFAGNMRSSVEKIEDTWLQRVNTEQSLQRSYKVSVSYCATHPGCQC